MKYRTLLGWTLGTALAAALITPVNARVWRTANGEIDLAQRIDSGHKSGTLTMEQAKQLLDEEAKLAEKERKLKDEHKGQLTADDQKDLQKDAEQLHEKILNLEATKPDNSAKNLGDGRVDSPVPQVQSEKKSDLTVTQKIRQTLVKDKDLSFNAKNVKVITINGTVTLRGVVDNSAEKDKIGAVAKECLGTDKVLNELTIATK